MEYTGEAYAIGVYMSTDIDAKAMRSGLDCRNSELAPADYGRVGMRTDTSSDGTLSMPFASMAVTM